MPRGFTSRALPGFLVTVSSGLMNVKHLLSTVLLAVPVLAGPATAQVNETEYRGAQALGLALRRLHTTGRVLMIGAHPDDENNGVLAALALGDGLDVAYLSLTRGDGGQNLIGPELKEGLGLIRTDELLAARRLDGARQYFGREYDYGFSKSADEAFRHWPRDSVVADVVEVIRKFRPDVILSVWSGTPRDGHGQHQASGLVTREAFEAAADPARFPGQIAAGLRAYKTPYLLQATWRQADSVAFWLSPGDFDPLFGRSDYQIALEGRSRHRSQGQGSQQPPGPQRSAVLVIAGAPRTGFTSLFQGLDTTLAGMARHAFPRAALLAATLDSYEKDVSKATTSWDALQPASIVPVLEGALTALQRADSLAGTQGGSATDLRFRIAAERDELTEALRLADGIVLDATASRPRVVPGEGFVLTVRLWNGGRAPLAVDRLQPVVPAGWTVDGGGAAVTQVRPGEMATREFHVHVPTSAPPSEPYFLRQPRQGDMYTWPADTALRGEPYAPPPVQAEATVRLAGQAVAFATAATFVDVDKATGERRLPVLIVPAISVLVEPRIAIAPISDAPANHSDGAGAATSNHDVTVFVHSEATSAVQGSLRLEAPAGWHVEPAAVPVQFAKAGQDQNVKFRVSPPAELAPGQYRVGAVFETQDGAAYRRGYNIIDYPHIRPRLLFRDAAALFSAFPLSVAQGLRVGYIEGAGDNVASALEQMGLHVEPVSAELLRSGDLSRFDVIVAGIRAYEVREDLDASNARVLDWVQRGGTYIVQYNQPAFAQGNYAPYPLSIASGDRVTDETAPVRILDSSSPVVTTPNRIGASDFDGWVQERGLYFPGHWDDHYTPVFEMNDPGEAPLRGSLLVTKYGRGTYVYVALSFFRELPEGVPGAYRLLANLVSLGAH